MAQRLDILEEKFLKTVKESNMIKENDAIVVGVSGGPDSIALLYCLNKFKNMFKYKIICTHINHLIREDSTDDELFVENVCKNMQIPFYKKRENIIELSKKLKKGTEETGRIVRYNFFDEILEKEKANKIAIAHNKNDNSETMLLNLIRGTGLNGLEGIQEIEYEKYIRPFINISRDEIESYCEKNHLEPRIDSTNKENIYNRNIIRNEILPIMKKINPNVIDSLSRTSKIIKEENEFIKNTVENTFNSINHISVGEISYSINDFNKLSKTIKENLILYTIEKLVGDTKNIEKTNVEDIIKLAEKNIGNKYMELNKNLKIFIENKKIFFTIIK